MNTHKLITFKGPSMYTNKDKPEERISSARMFPSKNEYNENCIEKFFKKLMLIRKKIGAENPSFSQNLSF